MFGRCVSWDLEYLCVKYVGERCAMWNEVFQSLLMDHRWMVIGDFNMVESSLERSRCHVVA